MEIISDVNLTPNETKCLAIARERHMDSVLLLIGVEFNY